MAATNLSNATMKSVQIAFACLFCCALPVFALSDDTQKILKALESAMNLELETTVEKKGETPVDRAQASLAERTSAARMIAARLRSGIENRDGSLPSDVLSQIPAYFGSADVKSLTEKLATTLEQERVAEQEANRVEIDAAIARAKQAVETATAAVEMDAVISEFSRLKEQQTRRSYNGRRAMDVPQLEPVYQFLTSWQDYLAAKAEGNLQNARSALDNLSNRDTPSLIPRSKVLALKHELAPREGEKPVNTAAESLKETGAVLSRVKKLDDLTAAVKELEQVMSKYSRQGGYNSPVGVMISTLKSLERTYREFREGLSTSIQFTMHMSDDGELPPVLAPLRAELLRLTLPRYISAPKGSEAKPGEAPQEYLERIVIEARERDEPALAMRAKEALATLRRGSAYSSSDASAINAYVSAQNQETAGQFMLAVISYQTALKSGSDVIPAKRIGERLAAIKSAHPKEFEEGTEKFLNPPQPVYRPSPYPPGYPFPGYPRAGGPTEPPSPATPSLLIPPPATSEKDAGAAAPKK